MSKKKKQKQKPWKKWLLGAAAILAVLTLAGCTAVMSVSNNLMDKGKVKDQSESSVIYDKDGHEITKLYSNVNREYVDYAHIPDIVKKAFVDTEDSRFYQHNGVDVLGIARAVYRDIRAGGAVEGASTITQQLAKNVYLTNTKSIWRKTQEALIALNLERNYSKDQILEFYLNEIYFGHGNYGVQAASKYYFGKDVSKLDLAEAATLAGMPKAPNTYAPIPNYDKSVERRQTVLSLMVHNGTITQQQADEAGKEKLALVDNDKNKDSSIQTYIDYVLQEAEDKYGLTEDQVYRGGYEIYTALDMNAQKAMADAFNNAKLFPPNSKNNDPVQGAMVILDPHTGGIAAMTGGRDYIAKGLNRATSRNRTPGSSFKPLAVYGPALEEGWHPYDMLKDEKMTFPGGYSPSNWYGDGYLGQVSMVDALKRSKNVPAVWLLNEIGIDKSFHYLDQFGVPYDKKNDRKLGIALGDINESPLDMAKGYSAFDNKGIVLEPHVITKIKDSDGNVKDADVKSSTAVSEKTASTMTSLLMGVVNDGTGKAAQMNRPVAGKTGTTQMPGTSGNRDAWFVGYTPEYVGAVWMGFDKSDPSSNYLRQGSEVPARFFSVVMTEALKGRPVKPFPNQEDLEPDQPPPLPAVGDLKAEPLADSIHLTWSAVDDKKFAYHVYRYADDPAKKQLIGDTQKGEWIDMIPKLDQPIHYMVMAYDTGTKLEGAASNIIEVRPKGLQPPDLKSPASGGNTPKPPNMGGDGTTPGGVKQTIPPSQGGTGGDRSNQSPTLKPGRVDPNQPPQPMQPNQDGTTRQNPTANRG